MKHIKQDFSLKTWVQFPGVDLVSGAKAKIKLFRNMVAGNVAYQIKADNSCCNMVANILPTDTPSTLELWSKGQTIFFLKVVMSHIKLKGIEHRVQ